jgi:hypothetical protein
LRVRRHRGDDFLQCSHRPHGRGWQAALTPDFARTSERAAKRELPTADDY